MKLKRLATLPFAMAADAVTLGNFGDRTYTQQVFDAERREQRHREYMESMEALSEVIKARRGGSGDE